MRTFPRLPALFVTFAVSSPALCLSLDQQLAYCSNVDGKFSADIQISGCTAIIDAGTADSRTLARIYFSRALAYDDKSEFALAIRDYNEVIRLNPDDATALNNRALDLAILGRDLEQALIDSNRAVSLEPVADDFSTRAFVYLRLHRYDEAIADDTKALEKNPKDAESLYARGIAKIAKGDKAGGSADVAAAKAITPDIADEFVRYGINAPF